MSEIHQATVYRDESVIIRYRDKLAAKFPLSHLSWERRKLIIVLEMFLEIQDTTAKLTLPIIVDSLKYDIQYFLFANDIEFANQTCVCMSLSYFLK